MGGGSLGGGGEIPITPKKKEILPAKKKNNSEIMKFLVRGEGGGQVYLSLQFLISLCLLREEKSGGLSLPDAIFFLI